MSEIIAYVKTVPVREVDGNPNKLKRTNKGINRWQKSNS